MVLAVAIMLVVAALALRTKPAHRNAGSGTAERAAEAAAPRLTRRAHAVSAAMTSQAARRPPGSRATPLPPLGAPLARIFDELSARAAAGDAAAASRLYRDVHLCFAARTIQRAIERAKARVRDGRDVMIVAPSRDTEPHELQEMTDFVRSNDSRCAGATDAQLDSFVPVALRAARLGDIKATDCIGGFTFDMMAGLLDHPEWLSAFRETMPSAFDHAVRQGDWVAVELLHHAYAGVFPDTPTGQVYKPDVALDYRYLRLEQLGAQGEFVSKLDRMVADAQRQLTPQQIADGDAWASDTYSRYFGNSPSNEVSNGANICQIKDDQ